MTRYSELRDLVDAIHTDQCVEWKGARSANGYGHFTVDGRTISAHRAAYARKNGPIPPGRLVLHSCDNRACINPTHLRLGSHAENMAERAARQRTARRESHGSSKLTAAQVAEIRADKSRQVDIAAKYGISQTHVSEIKLGKSWAGGPVRRDPMVPVMVRCDPRVYQELKAAARDNDRTVAQTIRRAINSFLSTANTNKEIQP